MSKNTPKANQLFQIAEEEGVLSPASARALQVVDIGAQIEAALGIPALDVRASEVTLVTIMPDDSSSIEFAENAQVVRDGHNLVIDSLRDAKLGEGILVHTRYLNGHILYPYCSLDKAPHMDQDNYQATGGTPLYDQSVIMLGTILAKAQEFAEEGVPVRTITLTLTDGKDEHSVKYRPADVAQLVQDMLLQETNIIAAMGIDDGRTDFRQIFREMGIRNEWILTPGNTPKEIRAAFQLFSSSAVQASQNAKSFSQAAMGGFGQI